MRHLGLDADAKAIRFALGPIAFAVVASTGCGGSTAPSVIGASPTRAPETVDRPLASLPERFSAGAELLAALMALPESPSLEFVEEIDVDFLLPNGSRPDYVIHPQGLAFIPTTGELVVSAVELREHRGKPGDPEPNGRGEAYLFFFGLDGAAKPRRTRVISLQKESFHPGGIDAEGGFVYASLSPYYPNSRADIVRVPVTKDRVGPPELLLELSDHIGVVSYVAKDKTIRAASWDARTWYTLSPEERRPIWHGDSPSDLAVQDGQVLTGTHHVLWTGNADPGAARFGLDVLAIEGRSMRLARSFRWATETRRSLQGRPPFYNATLAWSDTSNTVWFLTLPDDQHGRFVPRPHGGGDLGADEPDPMAGARASFRIHRIVPKSEP